MEKKEALIQLRRIAKRDLGYKVLLEEIADSLEPAQETNKKNAFGVAWEKIRDERDPKHEWSIGDLFNYRGFFALGWDSAQSNEKALREAALATLRHAHLQSVGHTFGLRVRDRGDDYIAKIHSEKDNPCEICKALAALTQAESKARL
jgi:hypothetical protein